jgi:hypothetical protein
MFVRKETTMKMRTFKLFTLILPAILFMGFMSYSAADETITQVSTAIQAGNATEVTKYFNSMVDLTLPGYDDTYSKTQAARS